MNPDLTVKRILKTDPESEGMEKNHKEMFVPWSVNETSDCSHSEREGNGCYFNMAG
jgi:hypothetical protein